MIKEIEFYTNNPNILKKFQIRLKENEDFKLVKDYWLFKNPYIPAPNHSYCQKFLLKLIINSFEIKDINFIIEFSYSYSIEMITKSNYTKMDIIKKIGNLIDYNQDNGLVILKDGGIGLPYKSKDTNIFKIKGEYYVNNFNKKDFDYIFSYIKKSLLKPLFSHNSFKITFIDKEVNEEFRLIFDNKKYERFNLSINGNDKFILINYNETLIPYITNTNLSISDKNIIISYIYNFINSFLKNPFQNFTNPLSEIEVISLL